MCRTKTPGPNYLPIIFFHKHWSSVKEGVVSTCLHILNEGGNFTPLNHTYIALILKVHKPRKVTDYIPISLCNVIYRIIAKTMVDSLSRSWMISLPLLKSACVPNRLIIDNIIMGYECLNKNRQSRINRKGLVALKLDISKTYDRMECVKYTMQKLEFSIKWLNLNMNCISTASFSILINSA